MVLQRAQQRPGRALVQRLVVDPGGQLIAAGQRQREGGMEVLVGALAAVGVAFRHGGRS